MKDFQKQPLFQLAFPSLVAWNMLEVPLEAAEGEVSDECLFRYDAVLGQLIIVKEGNHEPFVLILPGQSI